ncbi:hypothetical protein K7432_006141 [Basidiobolus ranarum]|uniref:Uncharacterized protein n=1 Tax=Basidiobolus ranarum TaxID=34480 RepID=A0ABR2WVD2_9FUNG
MVKAVLLILTLLWRALATIQIIPDTPFTSGALSYFSSYDFYQDSPDSYNFTSILLKAEILDGCRISPFSSNNTQLTYNNVSTMAIFISWKEASAKNCYEFSDIVSLLASLSKQLQSFNYPTLKVAVFTSTLESKFSFGNLYHESYGNYFRDKPSDIYLTIVAKDHGDILSNLLNAARNPPVIQIWKEPGPWNRLLQSPGFAVMQWLYFACSILFLIYITYRLYCFYVIHRIFIDVRVGIYVASFAYLLIGVCVDANKINGVVGQIAIYVSWLVGYLAYGGLLLTWGRIVLEMHGRTQRLRIFYTLLYFCMGNFTLVVILLIVGVSSKIAIVYKIAVIMMTNEVPVLFLLNAVLLGYYGCSFLRNLKVLELSARSQHCMRKLTLLAFATIPGWLLLMLTALLLASTLTATVVGYVANMITYRLAGFQLYGVFFLILALGEASEANSTQRSGNSGLNNEYAKDVVSS